MRKVILIESIYNYEFRITPYMDDLPDLIELRYTDEGEAHKYIAMNLEEAEVIAQSILQTVKEMREENAKENIRNGTK